MMFVWVVPLTDVNKSYLSFVIMDVNEITHFECVMCNDWFARRYQTAPDGRRHYNQRQRVCGPCREGFRPDVPNAQELALPALRARLIQEAAADDLRIAIERFRSARRNAERQARRALDMHEMIGGGDLFCTE